MAKYKVTYQCGCIDEIQLFGKTSDREWRLQQEEQRLCFSCYQEELRIEKEASDQIAIQASIDNNWAVLKGSEKQVKWAETLRYQALTGAEDLFFKLRETSNIEGLELLDKTLDWAKEVRESKWWIDRRDKSIPPALNLFLNSPFMTATCAEWMGASNTWRAKLEKTAKIEADNEILAEKFKSGEDAKSIGIVGQVKVWSSDCGEHKRVYGSGFVWFDTGRSAGTLENDTKIPDDQLREFCEKLCLKWKNFRFYPSK